MDVADPDVMFARLRPDRPGTKGQHVVLASARKVPPVVSACRGTRLRAIDIDPRYVDRLVGAPCQGCVLRAPSEVVMYLARISGRLYPPEDDVSEPTRPELAGPLVYASGMAALRVRHIVPEGARRYPHLGRLLLMSSCGHPVWCPVIGPCPSTYWPVCSDRVKDVRRRIADESARAAALGSPSAP